MAETVLKKIAIPRRKLSAKGLSYVDDHLPGIERRRKGHAFEYYLRGRKLRSSRTLDRIRLLVIPPAWEKVWICKDPRGHLQVTGIDDRGRKQYRYHDAWRELRDAAKYEKLIDFARALPRIRRRVTADLRRRGLPRPKVLAAIIRLMEKTLIRVGNEEYADSNGSYGLTTLRDRHAHVSGTRIRFDFNGKSGIHHDIDVSDDQLAKIVRKCQDLPGQQLFQYCDEQGQVHDVGSTDVNNYLREASGGEFTAKDFRTWAGTSLAAGSLQEFAEFTSTSMAKRNISKAIDQVAKRLGNTKAVCRKCYIHPAVIDAYLDRSLATALSHASTAAPKLSQSERGVLSLIESQIKHRSSRSSQKK